jgi:hypothetical protein
MTDDFVKELRRFSFHDRINEKPWEAVELIDAAADLIERFEKALQKIAQHDMQAIATDALRPGERIRGEGK